MFILIDEFGGVHQFKGELSEAELSANTQGVLTILRMGDNGEFEELNSMNQTEWTKVQKWG